MVVTVVYTEDLTSDSYIYNEKTKEFDFVKGNVILGKIEHLSCGHVNNLQKVGRVPGKCPKGCI